MRPYPLWTCHCTMVLVHVSGVHIPQPTTTLVAPTDPKYRRYLRPVDSCMRGPHHHCIELERLCVPTRPRSCSDIGVMKYLNMTQMTLPPMRGDMMSWRGEEISTLACVPLHGAHGFALHAWPIA
jgi:hypothetical protein